MGRYVVPMAPRRARHTLVPNANNVGFLTRVLKLVAQGIRETSALAEVLGCEPRTVHYYTQAGDWLGLLQTEKLPHLTRLGLEYVYGGRDQGRIYAEAVWQNSFVLELMAGRGNDLPEIDEIARFIQQADTEMAPTTVRRRASAVRSLIEPAMRFRRAPLRVSKQMNFDFVPRYHPGGTATPILDLRAGSDESPDVYRVVLQALLDHGELGAGHMRCLLDKAGAGDCPVGSYLEMAIRRGDAWRIDDRIAVSWGALWRRDLADTVVGVALSDPRYRSYLGTMRDAAAGDGAAAMRFSSSKERFAGWDRRIFGSSVKPAQLGRDLDRILLGRPIDSFPLAEDPGPDLTPLEGSFLDLLRAEGLVITLPPGLRLLLQGVHEVNKHLERAARTKNEVRIPEITDRRVLAHGGLFSPGTAPPRSIPDMVSLRLQAVSSIPHLALATGLLVLHRRSGAMEIRQGSGGPHVLWDGEDLGELLSLLDQFAESRGWLVSRKARGGVDANLLMDILVALGVADRLSARIVLDETFFLRMRGEAEDQDVAGKLALVEDMLQRFLEEQVSAI